MIDQKKKEKREVTSDMLRDILLPLPSEATRASKPLREWSALWDRRSGEDENELLQRVFKMGCAMEDCDFYYCFCQGAWESGRVKAGHGWETGPAAENRIPEPHRPSRRTDDHEVIDLSSESETEAYTGQQRQYRPNAECTEVSLNSTSLQCH